MNSCSCPSVNFAGRRFRCAVGALGSPTLPPLRGAWARIALFPCGRSPRPYERRGAWIGWAAQCSPGLEHSSESGATVEGDVMRATGQPRFMHTTGLLAAVPLVLVFLVPARVRCETRGYLNRRPGLGKRRPAWNGPRRTTIRWRSAIGRTQRPIPTTTSSSPSRRPSTVTPDTRGRSSGPMGGLGRHHPPDRSPELPDGLNWPEGRAILDNGCEMEPDHGPGCPESKIGDVHVCRDHAGAWP